MAGQPPYESQQDSYRYDPGDVTDFDERFTLEPVAPGAIEEHIAEGKTLVTMDIAAHLERGIAPDADAATSLYRLVQLFGTPNVPGLEAGADQPDRDLRTWQYLFELSYTPEEGGEDRTYLLSVYDYKTDVSVGLSEWADREGESAIPEPTGDPLDDVPAEATLETFVQLVLSTVEHAVEATYKGLHV